MLGPVQVSRYQKADRGQLFEFLKSVYPTEKSARMIQQWNWKYDDNPFNREPDPYVLLLKDGDAIIGMMGAIPLRFMIQGIERWVTNSCDSVVHPNYRGHRISAEMISRYDQEQPMGFGWANHISNRVVTGMPNISSTRMVPLYKPLALIRSHAKNPSSIEIIPFEDFDARFDDLWRQVRGDYPVMVVRDQHYLNWRFDSRPDAKYIRLAALRQGGIAGYVVIRLDEKDGMRRAYLVDWIAQDQTVFCQLVQTAIVRAKQGRASFIIARTTTPFFRRRLYRLGFVPWYWGTREYLLIRVNLPDPQLQILHDTHQWLSTMGDGDLETFF